MEDECEVHPDEDDHGEGDEGQAPLVQEAP